jgi:hypothetical protein
LIRLLAILVILLILAHGAAAQRARQTAPPQEKSKEKAASEDPKALAEAAKQSRAKLIDETKAYQASLEKLLPFYLEDEKRAAELVEKRRVLLAEGVISKRELEESEAALEEARSKIEDTRREIKGADQLLAEVIAAEQLAHLPVEPPGTFRSTVLLIRYTGTSRWALTDMAKVDGFFRATFGKAIPISAYGQTTTHDRLGFDHREGVDVAVHPDSPEGIALINFLRQQGIPFTAFRGPLAGSATGAHIHIGRPSARLNLSM